MSNSVTPWTVDLQAPLFLGIVQAKILESIAMPSSRVSSQPRDQTQVFHVAGGFLTAWATREAHQSWEVINSVEGFRFFCLFVCFCIFTWNHLLASARKSFPTKDFQVKSKSCFPMHFDPLPFKSCPYHWKFYRGKGEREKRKHTQTEEEREIFYEKLT